VDALFQHLRVCFVLTETILCDVVFARKVSFKVARVKLHFPPHAPVDLDYSSTGRWPMVAL